MKIKIVYLIFIYSAIISVKTYSQIGNHFHRVTKLKLVVPKNGTEKELNYLLKEWIKKIGERNSDILDYNIQKDIDGGIKLTITDEHDNRNLFEQRKKSKIQFNISSLKDKKNKPSFLLRLNKYINSHLEEIYPIEDFYIK